jgi:Tol biopolymer transport system component
MSLAGGRLGPYEILAKLGEGGMGEVYRARDTKLERQVAIKVLPAAFTEDPERLARFEGEAKVLAQLNHPNIAQIYGLESEGETRALVLELVDGPTLAERLESGSVPLHEALSFSLQIAQALEEAHEKGIVHRDLKPQNVKASVEGKVKVLDFGLAKAMDPLGAASGGSGSVSQLAQSPTLTLGATVQGVILGTAAYMAPEQAKGLAVDKRADIWAFGVVLYEMLAGRRLFAGDTVTDTLADVLRREIDFSALPAATPPAIRRLLRRCLERNPKNRLHDIGDARLVLAEVAAGTADEPGVGAAARPFAPRRREAVAWAVAAALALAVVALLALDARRPTSSPRVLRSTIELPPGVAIELDGERAGMPELSPDGTRIAFGAREGSGPMQIWVLELASGEARPIAGTEGGYRPFWSPDGQRVGFFTWGHLSTVPAAGGPVARLAPARDSRGGSWGADGTILFTPYPTGPVMAIAAGGGAVRPVSSMPMDSADGTDRYPHRLPDGRGFLYLSRAASYGNRRGGGIDAARLGETGAGVRVVDGLTNAIFAAGHLLYVRDRALVAQRFDPERFALVGEPSVLTDGVLFNDRFSYGVFSAVDGGVVAFMTGRQSDLSRLVWRDRAGRELGELGSPANYSGYGGLSVSPDGRWAAASFVDESRPDADLRIFDLGRGSETRLSRPGSDEFHPVFDTDGGAVFFGRRDDARSSVVRRDLLRGDEREVTFRTDGVDLGPQSVAPDGRSVTCDARRQLVRSDVVLVPTTGGGEVRPLRATPLDDAGGQLSPDGRWLVWSSDESGRYEVYVDRHPEGGALVQVSHGGGLQPRWSARRNELFFKTPDNRLHAVPIETGAGTVSVGTPVPLFPIVEYDGWTYAPAPDGERFLVREPITPPEASRIHLLTDWTALTAPR